MDELQKTKARLKRFEDFLECEKVCPCCEADAECMDGCTFAEDDPNGFERMQAIRELFAEKQ